MIVTTTNSVEGYQIAGYFGIVTGEAVSGINMFRDLGASMRNIFGGRSAGYEDELKNARNEVLEEMQARAAALGADAIVGASIGYETFEGMIMTCCSGTAVRLRRA